MQVSTIRPGLLVALSIRLDGRNVTYRRQSEDERVDDDGAEHSKWETERTIAIPREHRAAGKVRSKARACITAVCSQSLFGLLCPASREADLDAAITKARRLADEFNQTSDLSKVRVYAFTGQVAEDDAKAVRSLNAELRGLLQAMEGGIQELDVEKVREAAARAKSLGQMLTPEANERMKKAIDLSRAAATRINKAVKAGEAAALEIDRATLETLASARTAFLDLEEFGELEAPEAAGRAIDLVPTEAPAEADEAAVAPTAAARGVDLWTQEEAAQAGYLPQPEAPRAVDLIPSDEWFDGLREAAAR